MVGADGSPPYKGACEVVGPDPRGFVQRRRVFAAGRIESGRLVSLVCDQTAGGFDAVDSPTPAVLNTVDGPVRALYFETRGKVATGAVRRVLEEALDPAAALVHAQTFGVRGGAGATLEARR